MDQTAEEFEKSNIAKMGEPLGALYSALWQELATAYVYWLEYVELYGMKKERLELLNRAAPRFFRMVKDELWEMSLLHLTRLADPAFAPGQKDKPNLSIQGLAEVVTDAKLKDEVQAAVAKVIKATEFARDWRNRHIAHRDLKLALEQQTTALADASRAQVTEALKTIAAVLNVLGNHYFNSETRFDLVARHNGAITLLYVLHRGVKAGDEQIKRLQDGNPLDDSDFDPRDI